MSTARETMTEGSNRRPWLTVAAAGVLLAALVIWIVAAFDGRRLYVGLFSISPVLILAYLVATAAEWLARREKDHRLELGMPRWIVRANAIVSFLFLAAVGANILLLAMLLMAWLVAPQALWLVMSTLMLTVLGSIILVMALRTPLLFAEAVANLKDRRAPR